MKGESPRCHGSGSSDGNAGYGGSQFQGGTGGKGAEEGDNNYSGGGGGGFETNGRSNQNFGGAKGTGGEGGKSFYKGNGRVNRYKPLNRLIWLFLKRLSAKKGQTAGNPTPKVIVPQDFREIFQKNVPLWGQSWFNEFCTYSTYHNLLITKHPDYRLRLSRALFSFFSDTLSRNSCRQR